MHGPRTLKQDCSFGTIAFLVSCYYGKVLGTESEADCLSFCDTQISLGVRQNSQVKNTAIPTQNTVDTTGKRRTLYREWKGIATRPNMVSQYSRHASNYTDGRHENWKALEKM